ncbi:NAD-dependent epimerase/dehydratase family protein [Listeria costaricensis]|uniref:NAD-dependent epimerase/dehydratase family protein n=1 Tax=Listeria costaricensis TaxID=2026604 RepID=UPI000C08C03E|nr:NAD-dependent epimerase/dehydratase family protein [Listeria costaricensis]
MAEVLIAGAGLIGQQVLKVCQAAGKSVQVIAKPPLPETYDEQVHLFGDLSLWSDAEITRLLSHTEIFVFAMGAGPHVAPPKPAQEFFFRVNVTAAERLTHLAKQAGVRQVVIMSSFFNTFAEKYPEWHLADLHPFIYASLQQEARTMAEQSSDFDVLVMRLPYLIGPTEGKCRSPWSRVVARLRAKETVYYFQGGASSSGIGLLTTENFQAAFNELVFQSASRGAVTLPNDFIESYSFYNIVKQAANLDFQLVAADEDQLYAQAAAQLAENRKAAIEAGIHPVHGLELRKRALQIEADAGFSFRQSRTQLEAAIHATFRELM